MKGPLRKINPGETFYLFGEKIHYVGVVTTGDEPAHVFWVWRIMVKRAKYKHWFELGRHAETDAAFEQALADGSVRWNPRIVDLSRLF